MDLYTLSKLPLSAELGWPELIRRRPGFLRLFLVFVLPLALIPPLMLYLAGRLHPEMFGALGLLPAGGVAGVSFAAELFTVLALGWLIRQVATTQGLAIDYHGAYLLAVVTPAPMWLSSLGLAIPDLLVFGCIAVLGLGLSCATVYHGIIALSRPREEMLAVGIAHVVIGVALIGWACLLAIALAESPGLA